MATPVASEADVLVITNIRSYHQVDLFDAIARSGQLSIFVIYLLDNTVGRPWPVLPKLSHRHRSLPAALPQTRFFLNPGLPREIRRVRPRMAVVCQYVGLSNAIAMADMTYQRIPWVFWSESPGVRLFEVNSPIPDRLRCLGRRAALFFIGRCATQVWGVGKRAAETYARATRLPGRNLPYYSDLSRFRAGRTGRPATGVRILFAGRCSYRKGFDTVLAVTRRLADECCGQSWTLTICGEGELLQLVNSLPGSVRSRIECLGFRGLDEMPAVFAGHDILLCPSRYDGWGMVVPEALACGLMVVSTPDTGSAYEIGQRDGLVLVPTGDVEGMVKVLARFLRSPETLEAGRRDALEAANAFSAEVGVARFCHLAEEVLGKPTGPGE